MFKRIFQFSSSEKEAALAGRNGSAVHAVGMVELSNALQRETERAPTCAAVEHQGVSPVLESFEEVYLNAGIKTAGKNYTILKIAEMVNSRHLSDMTPEAKRNSLMMALEAAGAEIGDLLQDAVTRNRALDEYEEERQEEVRKFEAVQGGRKQQAACRTGALDQPVHVQNSGEFGPWWRTSRTTSAAGRNANCRSRSGSRMRLHSACRKATAPMAQAA